MNSGTGSSQNIQTAASRPLTSLNTRNNYQVTVACQQRACAVPLMLLLSCRVLVEGFTACFRLPSSPSGVDPMEPSPAASPTPTTADDIFLRIMQLPKGRTLMARALRVLLTMPPAFPEELTHGTQRTAGSDTVPAPQQVRGCCALADTSNVIAEIGRFCVANTVVKRCRRSWVVVVCACLAHIRYMPVPPCLHLKRGSS